MRCDASCNGLYRAAYAPRADLSGTRAQSYKPFVVTPGAGGFLLAECPGSVPAALGHKKTGWAFLHDCDFLLGSVPRVSHDVAFSETEAPKASEAAPVRRARRIGGQLEDHVDGLPLLRVQPHRGAARILRELQRG